jgi:50S ribosomal protein L16 3-hydroxylase
LIAFAEAGVKAALKEPGALKRALGEFLSEPKASVSFPCAGPLGVGQGVALSSCSCMLYDDDHVFLNGEAWNASGADAHDLRELADRRLLDARRVGKVSVTLRRQLANWIECGWLVRVDTDGAT